MKMWRTGYSDHEARRTWNGRRGSRRKMNGRKRKGEMRNRRERSRGKWKRGHFEVIVRVYL